MASTTAMAQQISISPSEAPKPGAAYSDNKTDISTSFLSGLHSILAAKVTDLKVTYQENGNYDVIKYKLDRDVDNKTLQGAIKRYADAYVGWQQCVQQNVRGYDAGLFCIHTNNNNIVGYAFKAGEIKNVKPSDSTAKKLLTNKQNSGK